MRNKIYYYRNKEEFDKFYNEHPGKIIPFEFGETKKIIEEKSDNIIDITNMISYIDTDHSSIYAAIINLKNLDSKNKIIVNKDWHEKALYLLPTIFDESLPLFDEEKSTEIYMESSKITLFYYTDAQYEKLLEYTKQNKIIVEEEKTKNPLLLFFRKNKKMLLIFLILLALSTLLVSVGGAIITIQKSQEFDLSFLNGSKKEITTNNDPTIKDEDVEEELLGPIARHEGVILLTKTFLDSDNNVIYYFSDNSAIIVKSNGKIYRVSPLENGNYGIDEKGNINSKAKKILVKATTSTLKDGTVITYYSDGSAKLEHNGITTFVRDSNNIKLDAGVSLKNVVPSGVSISDNITKKSDITMITYTDKSKQITINNQKYILNSKIDTTVDNENIAYDSNNIFKVRKETILKDGNTITYYENGSAVITDNDNNTIYVKKSGDIVIKNKKIYEIITNKYGYSTITKKTNDNKKVTYFDNGAAIIENKDGTKSYIEDNNDIIYDSVNKIKGSPSQSNQKSVKKTTDGYTVINF